MEHIIFLADPILTGALRDRILEHVRATHWEVTETVKDAQWVIGIDGGTFHGFPEDKQIILKGSSPGLIVPRCARWFDPETLMHLGYQNLCLADILTHGV